MVEAAGRDLAKLTASDIGFAIGPRLNAAGRLEDMALGIECLICDDPTHARELASVLDRINAERRGLQQKMVEDAEALMIELPDAAENASAALCLFDDTATRFPSASTAAIKCALV